MTTAGEIVFTFTVCRHLLGVAVRDVSEVGVCPFVAPLHHPPAPFVGVAAHRGHVVPVVDLCPRHRAEPPPCLFLHAGDALVALVADELGEVAQICPVADELPSVPSWAVGLVTAIATAPRIGLVLLIDANAFRLWEAPVG